MVSGMSVGKPVGSVREDPVGCAEAVTILVGIARMVLLSVDIGEIVCGPSVGYTVIGVKDGETTMAPGDCWDKTADTPGVVVYVPDGPAITKGTPDDTPGVVVYVPD